MEMIQKLKSAIAIPAQVGKIVGTIIRHQNSCPTNEYIQDVIIHS